MKTQIKPHSALSVTILNYLKLKTTVQTRFDGFLITKIVLNLKTKNIDCAYLYSLFNACHHFSLCHVFCGWGGKFKSVVDKSEVAAQKFKLIAMVALL